jgi:HK97 family phage prohead protease
MTMVLHKGYIQPFEVKDVDTRSGTLVQAYTRYDVVDSDNDRGRKGMFNKAWRENKDRIRHLLNHDPNRAVGNPVEFWEENEYAYMKSNISTDFEGQDFIKKVESKLIKEASYGYTVTKSNKLKDGTNELLEVKLWEVSSLTSWGANQFTPIISLTKGMDKTALFEDYVERLVNYETFIKNSTATDQAIQEAMVERDQIKSFLKTLIHKTGTEAVLQSKETLQPQLMKEDVLDSQIKGLLAQIEIQKQLLTA